MKKLIIFILVIILYCTLSSHGVQFFQPAFNPNSAKTIKPKANSTLGTPDKKWKLIYAYEIHATTIVCDGVIKSSEAYKYMKSSQPLSGINGFSEYDQSVFHASETYKVLKSSQDILGINGSFKVMKSSQELSGINGFSDYDQSVFHTSETYKVLKSSQDIQGINGFSDFNQSIIHSSESYKLMKSSQELQGINGFSDFNQSVFHASETYKVLKSSQDILGINGSYKVMKSSQDVDGINKFSDYWQSVIHASENYKYRCSSDNLSDFNDYASFSASKMSSSNTIENIDGTNYDLEIGSINASKGIDAGNRIYTDSSVVTPEITFFDGTKQTSAPTSTNLDGCFKATNTVENLIGNDLLQRTTDMFKFRASSDNLTDYNDYASFSASKRSSTDTLADIPGTIEDISGNDLLFRTSDQYKVTPSSKEITTMLGFSDYDQGVFHSSELYKVVPSTKVYNIEEITGNDSVVRDSDTYKFVPSTKTYSIDEINGNDLLVRTSDQYKFVPSTKIYSISEIEGDDLLFRTTDLYKVVPSTKVYDIEEIKGNDGLVRSSDTISTSIIQIEVYGSSVVYNIVGQYEFKNSTESTIGVFIDSNGITFPDGTVWQSTSGINATTLDGINSTGFMASTKTFITNLDGCIKSSESYKFVPSTRIYSTEEIAGNDLLFRTSDLYKIVPSTKIYDLSEIKGNDGIQYSSDNYKFVPSTKVYDVSDLTGKDLLFRTTDKYQIMPSSKALQTMIGFSDYDQGVLHSSNAVITNTDGCLKTTHTIENIQGNDLLRRTTDDYQIMKASQPFTEINGFADYTQSVIHASETYKFMPSTKTISGNANRHITLNSGSAILPSAAFAELQKVGTNRNKYVCAFDQFVDENAEWDNFVDEEYAGGAIIAEIIWYSTKTVGGTHCSWNIAFSTSQSAGSSDSVYGIVYASNSITLSANLDQRCIITIATPSSFVANSDLGVKVTRDANGVGDTLTCDAILKKVVIKYDTD